MGFFSKVVKAVEKTVTDPIQAAQDIGGDVSDTWKKAGGDISEEVKRGWENLNEGAKQEVNGVALTAATESKDSGAAKDYDSCMMIVASVVAAWGGAQVVAGNKIYGAIAVGSGYPAAHLACSRIFPEE